MGRALSKCWCRGLHPIWATHHQEGHGDLRTKKTSSPYPPAGPGKVGVTPTSCIPEVPTKCSGFAKLRSSGRRSRQFQEAPVAYLTCVFPGQGMAPLKGTKGSHSVAPKRGRTVAVLSGTLHPHLEPGSHEICVKEASCAFLHPNR